MHYHWRWAVLLEATPQEGLDYIESLLVGLAWTLSTAIPASLIALVLGIVVGSLRTSAKGLLGRAVSAYVELFRNIPLLVQMFLWYFVFPKTLPQSLGSWIINMPRSSFFTAIVCLGFFSAARVAEQVNAGISALPMGQRMAGMALGLSVPQNFRLILLPQALRIIVPTLATEFVNVIQNTAAALAIGLIELTASARSMAESSFQVFEAFSAATAIYLFVNVVVFALFQRLEHSLGSVSPNRRTL